MAPNAINKAANLWVSRIIPVFLFGLVGYVTWVVVVLICGLCVPCMCRGLLLTDPLIVKYLLSHNNPAHHPRNGAAIVVLVLYFLLLILMAWPYFRILYTVTFNPGYVPLGSQVLEKDAKNGRIRRTRSSVGVEDPEHSMEEKQTASQAGRRDDDRSPQSSLMMMPVQADHQAGPAALNLQDFSEREIYVCKGDGMPLWCSTCQIWKPDRAHHCREIGRCVRKMDHFCPWVGGVVSETSFNFFIQFTAWTAVFCIFNIVHLAIFVAEYRHLTGTANVHWIIVLGIAALFALFTLGMTGSSVQFALVNTTTIENLSRKTLVWDLAVHVPEALGHTIAIPSVSFASSQVLPHPAYESSGPPPMKRFAILHSKPGDNPWDLGAYRNFQSVMGYHWYEWVFPLRQSPCCDHSSEISQFDTGSVVWRMRKDAGLLPADQQLDEKSHRRRRHRKRRRRRNEDDQGTLGIADMV